MTNILITEEAVLDALAQFQPVPVLKGAPGAGYTVVGSLCLDNPLSRAIDARLPGRSAVSLCDGMIRVDHKGNSVKVACPGEYLRFDILFCEYIYASRNRSKKKKAEAAKAYAAMMKLLPMSVEMR